jgi:hypothetical protein
LRQGCDVSEFATILLLSAHLGMVDLAMAGPLVCIWLEWRQASRGDELAGRMGPILARSSAWALAGGIALGILLLGLRYMAGDPAYFAALGAIPVSRLWFGLAELVFSLGLLGLYAGLWDRFSRRRWWHRILAFGAASNLMIHFPALFIIVSIVSTRLPLAGQTLDAAAYRRMLVDGEVLSRVVHVWLAAFAVAGASLMGLVLRHSRDSQSAAPLIQRAAVVCLIPSVLQIPTGLWIALEMPEAARAGLLGGDAAATGLFLVAIAVALYWIHAVAAIAFGDCDTRHVRRSILALVLLLVLMVAARSRPASLGRFTDVAENAHDLRWR